MSKATRRTLQFADLEEVVADVRRLHAGGYTQLGNWSLGQCCNHLAQAVELTLQRYPFRFPPPISTINRLLFFGTSWVPTLIGKLRVPTLPGFGQKKPVDDTKGMNRLIDSVARLQAANEADLQSNPLLGKLTKEQWQRFQVAHAQRHLGFLIPVEASAEDDRQEGQTENESATVRS